jgi:protein RecA
MKQELINRLKGAVTLNEVSNLKFISTGSYALNYVISGDYKKGVPIGAITQLRGSSSTGKTLFATTIIKEAQRLGYYTKLLDAENAFSREFALKLGIDPNSLLYSTPETVEEAFDDLETTIKAIREEDKETPIVIVLDSLAVLPSKEEFLEQKDIDKGKSNFETNPMDGALRAKVVGSCLRKANPLLKKYDVCFVIINQIRSKVGVIYGNPDTLASGGKSLEYYLAVDLTTKSNKTSDVIRDEKENPIGIEGEVECKKNKCSIPYRTCKFKVEFDKGLDPFFGLLESLVTNNIVTQGEKGRYQYKEAKFTKNTFVQTLLDQSNADMSELRGMIGL